MKTKQLEEALIGAVLNPLTTNRVMEACEKRGVTAAWFARPEAKRVWPILETQWRTHHSVDGVLVAQTIGQSEAAVWLRHCIDIAPQVTIATEMVEEFVSAYVQSLAFKVGQQVCNDALEIGGPAAIANAEAAIVAFHDAQRSIYGAEDTLEREVEAIMQDYHLLHQKRVVEGDRKFFIGVPMPWEVLNRCYTGVKPGLHIIAARPSQGKTALAVTISTGMAALGIKQLVFSLDMARRELLKRYGSLLGQVSVPRLEFGGTSEELDRMQRGMNRFGRLGSPTQDTVHNIRISTSFHINRIIGEIYRAVKCEGVRCIWIDYLQEIQSHRQGTQKEQIDEVLARLKQCALNLKIPIFCLCQLNRDLGKDPNRQPTLTDLGDSGRIERDASTVLILWSDPEVRKTWDKTPPLALAGGDETLAKTIEPIWLLLLKNQQGPTRKFPFVNIKSYFTFRPCNHDAKAIRANAKSKTAIDRSPFFGQIRDDFINLEQPDGNGLDDRIKKHGALGKRGL